MIHSLSGTLQFCDMNTAIVECGGVGFQCNISMYTRQQLPQVGQSVFLFTHLNVREDAMELYGFIDTEEQQMFRLITTVSGVGPKIALAILSELDTKRLPLAIASGDAKSIQRANGVGPKMAQRICLELKDKIGKASFVNADVAAVSNAAASSNTGDAIEALTSLGYSQSEAAQAVGQLDPSLSVEELIKGGLSALAKKL